MDLDELLRRLKLEAEQIDCEISALESQDLMLGQEQEPLVATHSVSGSTPKVN